jgi:hypothetical protein
VTPAPVSPLEQNPSFFDADGEKTWVWNCNGELAPYDADDDVFFLVGCAARARGSRVSDDSAFAGVQRGF